MLGEEESIRFHEVSKAIQKLAWTKTNSITIKEGKYFLESTKLFSNCPVAGQNEDHSYLNIQLSY